MDSEVRKSLAKVVKYLLQSEREYWIATGDPDCIYVHAQKLNEYLRGDPTPIKPVDDDADIAF
jgi:hypothetical protein